VRVAVARARVVVRTELDRVEVGREMVVDKVSDDVLVWLIVVVRVGCVVSVGGRPMEAVKDSVPVVAVVVLVLVVENNPSDCDEVLRMERVKLRAIVTESDRVRPLVLESEWLGVREGLAEEVGELLSLASADQVPDGALDAVIDSERDVEG